MKIIYPSHKKNLEKIDRDLLLTHTFRNNPITDNISNTSFINKTLLLSKIAQKESLTVDTQIRNFEHLESTLQKNNPIEPTMRIYLTNKPKDLYELVILKGNNENNTYLSEIPFDEFFQVYKKKYSYYSNPYKTESKENNHQKRKKTIELLPTFDFYKKLKDKKSRMVTLGVPEKFKDEKSKKNITESLTNSHYSNNVKSTQLPSLTDSIPTYYKSNQKQYSLGVKAKNNIRSKFIKMMEKNRLSAKNINKSSIIEPFTIQKKIKKEIKLSKLLNL